MADIEALKKQAIEETIVFFKNNHSLDITEGELLNLLNKEEKYINVQLEHNKAFLHLNRKEELKAELLKYIDTNEKQRLNFILEPLGYVSNSKPINVVNEYCLYSFYCLFHSELYYEYFRDEGNENKPQAVKEKNYEFENKVLVNIYDLCSDFILTDLETFIHLVRKGSFSELSIIEGNKSRLQHLVYKLSRYIGDDWYSNIVNSKKWKKSDCSKKFEHIGEGGKHYKWSIKLNNLIPMNVYSIK